ncbi:SNAP protein [Catovirus CTV1]|uniref:Gamma-soluble NSF attachment protein n=1 Tax=Catovirus CTV1 TaxID=1977631 RepID=A0A1V0SBL6_9VIRU|nr:SNAP protein [Catovirus CTV1]
MSVENRADALKKEADSIYSKFIYFGNRYEDASSNYINAAKLYKMLKKYDKSIECLKKALDCFNRLNHNYDKLTTLNELAITYQLYDKNMSIKYYKDLIDFCIEKDYYDKLAKFYYELSGVYEQICDYKNCAEFYEKAADMYSSDNQRTLAAQCYDKYAVICVELDQPELSVNAMKTTLSLLENESRFILFKYAYRLAVCEMFAHSKKNDMIGFSERLQEIADTYMHFNTSTEHLMLVELARAYTESNLSEFIKILKEYDDHKRLDESFVRMFTKIKKNLENNINIDINDDDDLT